MSERERRKAAERADRIFIAFATAFALTGFTAIAFSSLGSGERIHMPDGPRPKVVPAGAVENVELSPQVWFSEIRSYCNPVDVTTRLRWSPAPQGPEGAMYEAACLALAGKIDDARDALLGLEADDRWRGAGIVFEAGHPAADAGDELAAGPLMELVVEFWPNHYMALYHAGAAAYERGEHGPAEDYLERFLIEYSMDDGWRSSAEAMLERIGRVEPLEEIEGIR